MENGCKRPQYWESELLNSCSVMNAKGAWFAESLLRVWIPVVAMAVISYHALRAPGEALRTVLASCTLELSNCSLICRHLSPMRQSGPATKLGSIFLHNQLVNGGERPCSVLARFGSSNGAGKLRHFGHGMPIGVCSQAGRRHHRRKDCGKIVEQEFLCIQRQRRRQGGDQYRLGRNQAESRRRGRRGQERSPNLPSSRRAGQHAIFRFRVSVR